MAEKLRRKFILISITAVFIVIFAIGLFSNLSNYAQIKRNAEQLVQVLTDNDGYFPKLDNSNDKIPLPPKMSPEAPFSTRFFTIKLNDENTLLEVDTGKISSTTRVQAIEYTNQVLQSGKNSGIMNDYKYLVSPTEYGYIIVFVDISKDLALFYSFLMNSVITGLIAVVSVFVIVFALSKKAIAPIVEGYEKQKQFITDAGHELKTPLAIIDANTEVLEINHGESQWTKSIHNQINRLSHLVESMISLTRMDEEKSQLNKKEFSLSRAILESIEDFRDLTATNSKKLSILVEKNISYYGDESLITQLIVILMDNALKYSVNESMISISLKKEGKKIILETRNEAENLQPGNYDKLLERFYRADTSRNSSLGGYGIGLSLAKAIVEKHKGKISVNSSDGKTLVFHIEL